MAGLRAQPYATRPNFHYTTGRSFCQAIFQKNLHKFISRNLCILPIAIPAKSAIIVLSDEARANQNKNKKIQKSA